MNAKEMVKAMRVGLEPIRKVEIGALEDVLCIRFPEKSGVWVKSSGGMPFVRPEKSLHSFCVPRGRSPASTGSSASPLTAVHPISQASRKCGTKCLRTDGFGRSAAFPLTAAKPQRPLSSALWNLFR